MPNVLQDLEGIREETLKLLAASDDDVAQILKWGARRELIFARLRESDLRLAGDELAAATTLIKEIVMLDATILARLQQNLATLSQQRTTANKMQKVLAHRSLSYPSVFLRRTA